MTSTRCFVWHIFLVFGIATGQSGSSSTFGQSIAKHVVQIGVDGLKPSCMNDAPCGNPNMMKRIAGKGTYTLTKARTVIETWSAPGWTANLCSMDSTATGVLKNEWSPPWKGKIQSITPVTGNDTPFPCVYQTIKQQSASFRTSSFYSWDWLKHLHNEAVPGSVDEEYHCEGSYSVCDAKITSKASAYLRQTLPTATGSYTFIYFGNVDSSGHSYGWCGPEYLDDVSTVDSQIGQILDAIESVNMQNQTLVLLSADHGGEGNGHGCRSDACLEVPVMIRGPSVKQNHQFKYNVYNKDLVPTATHALGLKPSPYWQGRVMKEAFNN